VNAPRIGVVAAAGRGQRIHPRSASVPKVLLDVAGKPLLTRQLELLRDACGIRDVYLVVGHLAAQVRAAYGDGAALGLRLTYLDNPDVDRGLGTLLAVVEPHVREPFVLLLGDEVYVGSNHAALAAVPGPYVAVCGVVETFDPAVVR
jgi:NDP-sugar pyrophosphorylase family protein